MVGRTESLKVISFRESSILKISVSDNCKRLSKDSYSRSFEAGRDNWGSDIAGEILGKAENVKSSLYIC